MTNKQRAVSYDKQLRRAERKAAKLKVELETQSIPRKTASPHYINVPHGMRTVRPLAFGSSLWYDGTPKYEGGKAHD